MPALQVGGRVGHRLDRGHDGASARVVERLQLRRAVRLVYVGVQPARLTVGDGALHRDPEDRGEQGKVAAHRRSRVARARAHITPCLGSPWAHSCAWIGGTDAGAGVVGSGAPAGSRTMSSGAFSFGFTVDRITITRLSTSNQNGAPREIAKAVSSQPGT